MAGIKIQAFGGMFPAVDDRLLRDNAAAWAENTWLYSGRLAGIPQKTLVKALTANTAKVFRIPNGLPDAAHIDDSEWLEFEDPNTDVVRAVVIDDTFDRYYWASTSDVPRYNTKARIAAGNSAWKLGIPAPEISSVVHSGGTGSAASRAYIATWVSAYGEEGPASDPVLATGKVDGTWDITLQVAAGTDTGGQNGDDRYLTHVRIYRTITSASGVTTYFFVAEQDIADTTYSDTDTDATISGNNELESTLWTAPPSDLQGMIVMPNGIIAGFRQNEVWFSEPYRPHAWPASYVVATDFPIVGLGVTGQSLVVCTQGNPVIISGINPSAMSVSKSALFEPCTSRGSILSNSDGVYYASPNGLIFVGGGGITNITRNLFSKEEWNRRVNIDTLHAARVGSAYFAFGSAQAGVFQDDAFDVDAFEQEDFTGAYQGILLDPADERLGATLLSDPTPTVSVQNDVWSTEVFFIQGTDPCNLYRMDIAEASPVRRNYLWRSKKFQVTKKGNFGAMKVFWEVNADAPDAEGTPPELQDPTVVEFPSLPDGTTYGVVRVYGDGTLRLTRPLLTSGELIRMPSGFKADFWQLEFETYVEILSVQVAGSARELASG